MKLKISRSCKKIVGQQNCPKKKLKALDNICMYLQKQKALNSIFEFFQQKGSLQLGVHIDALKNDLFCLGKAYTAC
jgi:hypothetical protein